MRARHHRSVTVRLDACPDLRDTAVLAVYRDRADRPSRSDPDASSRSFAAFWGDLDDRGRPAKKESKK